MSTIKKIGILGGSFNPPHLGHVAMAKLGLERGGLDQVWVIPCFEHPFEKALVSFEHRYKMCELAFQDLGVRVRVLDIEKKLGGKSFTYRTVVWLKKKYPSEKFVLIIGEDCAREAKTWHRYEELKKEVEWLVLPRGEKSPIPDISATATRAALQEGKGLEKFLNKNVIEYIEKNRLYPQGGDVSP